MIKSSVQRKLSSNLGATQYGSKRKKRILSSNDQTPPREVNSPKLKRETPVKPLVALVKPDELSKISRPPALCKIRSKKSRKSDLMDKKRAFGGKYKNYSMKNKETGRQKISMKGEGNVSTGVRSLQNHTVPGMAKKFGKQSSFQDEMLREVETRRGNSVLRGKRANFKKKSELSSPMNVVESSGVENVNSQRRVSRKSGTQGKVGIIQYD